MSRSSPAAEAAARHLGPLNDRCPSFGGDAAHPSARKWLVKSQLSSSLAGRIVPGLAKSVTSPEVILVHGLYHQPQHMQPLRETLEARGATVHVPRLHRGSLAADTEAVQGVVDACQDRPVLVAHSYGGAVTAGVEGAASFVFMAAFTPRVGESCAQLGGPDAPVNSAVRPHPQAGTFIPADAAVELFYADCDPQAARRAVNLLVPQASGHGRGVVEAAPWERSGSHYIVCSDDRAMSPALQLRMAKRCSSHEVLSASHSPYISQPQHVATAVLGRAADR
ncbi:alpha/beta hydrolase [Curtobacterium sp. C2H10]|nr:alpha/beta hydrolase [Curtobacterium sp. C2H10]